MFVKSVIHRLVLYLLLYYYIFAQKPAARQLKLQLQVTIALAGTQHMFRLLRYAICQLANKICLSMIPSLLLVHFTNIVSTCYSIGIGLIMSGGTILSDELMMRKRK